eukprot:c21854_g1_i2 orf=472-1329(-)
MKWKKRRTISDEAAMVVAMNTFNLAASLPTLPSSTAHFPPQFLPLPLPFLSSHFRQSEVATVHSSFPALLHLQLPHLLSWPCSTFQQLQLRRKPSRTDSAPPLSGASSICLASGADYPVEPGVDMIEGSAGQMAAGISSPETEKAVEPQSFWTKWQTDLAEIQARVAKLGLAAVLAYGIFDGITYTTFFVLAFLGYEKSTGRNPAANIQALLGIVILMWTGNNVTRPLRVAGAAVLAPLVDRSLKKIQQVLKLPNQLIAFTLVVASFASMCLSVVGLLILLRLTK